MEKRSLAFALWLVSANKIPVELPRGYSVMKLIVKGGIVFKFCIALKCTDRELILVFRRWLTYLIRDYRDMVNYIIYTI